MKQDKTIEKMKKWISSLSQERVLTLWNNASFNTHPINKFQKMEDLDTYITHYWGVLDILQYFGLDDDFDAEEPYFYIDNECTVISTDSILDSNIFDLDQLAISVIYDEVDLKSLIGIKPRFDYSKPPKREFEELEEFKRELLDDLINEMSTWDLAIAWNATEALTEKGYKIYNADEHPDLFFEPVEDDDDSYSTLCEYTFAGTLEDGTIEHFNHLSGYSIAKECPENLWEALQQSVYDLYYDKFMKRYEYTKTLFIDEE